MSYPSPCIYRRETQRKQTGDDGRDENLAVDYIARYLVLLLGDGGEWLGM